MESRIEKSSDMFSFPEFVFDSPLDLPFNNPKKYNDSPADLFFLNGRLLPHVFPIQEHATKYGTTRRSSSVGSSKDSLMSWSPSISSTCSNRSSRCSSARISSSDNSERRIFHNSQSKFPRNTTNTTSERNYQDYGRSSKRWQFLTPPPALKHGFAHRKKATDVAVKDYLRIKKQVKERTNKESGFRQRFFRLFCLPVENIMPWNYQTREMCCEEEPNCNDFWNSEI